MKIIILLFSVLIITAPSLKAQFNISGGMGIDIAQSVALNDYISFNISQRRPDFNTNAEFYGEFGYLSDDKYQIGFEYAFGINSYQSGTFDISYDIHMPSVLAYYIISGYGYKFKFGGGVGYRYVSLDETRFSVPVNFTAAGYGVVLKVVGNTSLGDNLFADVTGLLRFDHTDELKNNNGRAINYGSIYQDKVTLSQSGAGFRLGLSYYF
ncbi:MAG: hypothetical protein WCJ01_04290 [Ignavibacteria bacterium]